jgi:4a-hydroxytetrahydrobiopterin dehydratase
MEAMLAALAEKECVPCKAGTPPLQGAALKDLRDRLGGGWMVVDDHHLEKEFKFKDFRKALDFTNAVGALAESQNHHPDILLSWGKARITLWTHTVNGLSEADFVLAAKVETLPTD